MKRTESDLKLNIKYQLRFLKNSCTLFDKAKCNQIEASRIATSLNILFNLGKYKGLVQRLNFQGLLLSTSPKVEDFKDRLIIRNCLDEHELDKLKVKAVDTNFNLFFIDSLSKWYLFAKNAHGETISDFISKIRETAAAKGYIPIIWLEDIKTPEFTDEMKEIIAHQIANLLRFRSCPFLFFPLVELDKPLLHKDYCARFISVEEWMNEIIFCATPDDSRKRHILTRQMLIITARDKDGGAHVDSELNNVSEYILSKLGVTLGGMSTRKITTANYHMFMLRQLGYEILNSPDLLKCIK